jgi:hypothetical protein
MRAVRFNKPQDSRFSTKFEEVVKQYSFSLFQLLCRVSFVHIESKVSFFSGKIQVVKLTSGEGGCKGA